MAHTLACRTADCGSTERLFYCDHIEEHGESFFRMVCEHDLEGIVAKRKFDPTTPTSHERAEAIPLNFEKVVAMIERSKAAPKR